MNLWFPDGNQSTIHNYQLDNQFKNHKTAIEIAEKYIDNKYFESYFAYYLERAIFQKLYEEELVDLFSDFKEKYPKSSYSKHLLPGVNEIIKYHVAIKDSNPEIHILKNYEKINSLEECIKLFQGENLYIDIWATWCGPCKVEFKHKQELNKLLNEKGFKLLYISTDKDINNDKWIEMINGLELGGQHVRTNELFHKNLNNMHKVYSIPRYMIVNKNGEIIYNNAAKPSEIKKLEKQLEEI